MRARMVEVVAGMLDDALRAEGRGEVGADDLDAVAYALVGASRVAGRLARRPSRGGPGEDRHPDDERRLARRRPAPRRRHLAAALGVTGQVRAGSP